MILIKIKRFTPELLASLGYWITPYVPDQYVIATPCIQEASKRGPKPVILDNADIPSTMRNRRLARAIDDILHGVCRLDMSGNTRPLNKRVLRALLSHLDTLTAQVIVDVLQISGRHAQRYLKACKIAQAMIRKVAANVSWNDDELLIEQMEIDRMTNEQI